MPMKTLLAANKHCRPSSDGHRYLTDRDRDKKIGNKLREKVIPRTTLTTVLCERCRRGRKDNDDADDDDDNGDGTLANINLQLLCTNEKL